MTTMTKRLITLLGCTTLWACSLERTPDRSSPSASELTAVGSGSGSGSGTGSGTGSGSGSGSDTGSGSGSDTGSGSGSDTGSGSGSGSDTDADSCTCNAGDGSGSGSDASPSCADGPSQEQLDYAKGKLKDYLGNCTGQAAVDKLMKDFDTNQDGKIDKTELNAFLKKVGIGNAITRGSWCDGVLKEADKDGDGKISPSELKGFLDKIGLGTPNACGPAEDTAPMGPL